MIFDDTSILEDFSSGKESDKEPSLKNGSAKNRRNDKMRQDFFNKYAFMYSAGGDKPPSIAGSLNGNRAGPALFAFCGFHIEGAPEGDKISIAAILAAEPKFDFKSGRANQRG